MKELLDIVCIIAGWSRKPLQPLRDLFEFMAFQGVFVALGDSLPINLILLKAFRLQS
jgi:hypothetical protein